MRKHDLEAGHLLLQLPLGQLGLGVLFLGVGLLRLFFLRCILLGMVLLLLLLSLLFNSFFLLLSFPFFNWLLILLRWSFAIIALLLGYFLDLGPLSGFHQLYQVIDRPVFIVPIEQTLFLDLHKILNYFVEIFPHYLYEIVDLIRYHILVFPDCPLVLCMEDEDEVVGVVLLDEVVVDVGRP